ncbi:MAG: hypothetical protein GX783_02540 [Clostridiales bacterium]|nr:hypothetical protein [Clostridiales bacterium]
MQYDLVIIGTTVAALGLADTVKQDLKTLIINPTEMVAYEYMNTYKLPDVYSKGAEYYKEFQELGVDILLNTEISKIHEEENATYCLEVFTGTGFSTIKANAIVDTTEREVDIIEKSLNCLLVNKPGEDSSENISSKDDLKAKDIIESKDSNDVKEVKGVKYPEDDNEAFKEFLANNKEVSFVHQQDENLELQIMKLQCPTDMNMLEARHKLIDIWRERPQAYGSWKIANIGFCFEYKLAFALKKVTNNYTLLPSAYYNTPEGSFQAGVQLGRRLLG